MSESVANYTGPCYGGPLDGKDAVSRFPKGFLLVDKVENQCWIYEWHPEAEAFKVRDEVPMECKTEGEKNRYRAAEEPYYDVIAAPWIGQSNGD